MALKTYTVSIGRNIGDKPMSLERWNKFQGELKTILYMPNGIYLIPINVTSGKGYYNCHHEDTFSTSFHAHEPGATDDGRIPEGEAVKLTQLLSELARKYEQDCIVIMCAEPQFINA